MEANAEVREAQLLVELGVSTARHIEIEMVFGLADDLCTSRLPPPAQSCSATVRSDAVDCP